MATGRRTELEVTYRGALSAGRITVAPIRRSRLKVWAILAGVSLALGPGLWAAWKFSEVREENAGRAPVVSRLQIALSPGSATSERDGATSPATTSAEDGTLSTDLGQIEAGQAAVFTDLFRIRNDGHDSMLIYVEATGISEAPLHTAVGGDEAPGAYRVEPGEEQPVDVAVTADLTGDAGDVPGYFIVRTASGAYRVAFPALATVTPPPTADLIDTLLGIAGNPESGLGRVGGGDDALEPPGFQVDGVSDGAVYPSDVSFSWMPSGPLTDAGATLNGAGIEQSHTVTEEGDYVLQMTGLVMGVAPYTEQVAFRIDRTPPSADVAPAPFVLAEAARFTIHTADASRVRAVELVLTRGASSGGGDQPASSPSPSPTPAPSASPVPSASPEPTAQPTASPSPTAQPSDGGTTQSHENGAPASQTIRVKAKWDDTANAWVVDTQLPPGTFEVWAEARDAAGNVGSSPSQTVQVVQLVPTSGLFGV